MSPIMQTCAETFRVIDDDWTSCCVPDRKFHETCAETFRVIVRSG